MLTRPAQLALLSGLTVQQQPKAKLLVGVIAALLSISIPVHFSVARTDDACFCTHHLGRLDS